MIVQVLCYPSSSQFAVPLQLLALSRMVRFPYRHFHRRSDVDNIIHCHILCYIATVVYHRPYILLTLKLLLRLFVFVPASFYPRLGFCHRGAFGLKGRQNMRVRSQRNGIQEGDKLQRQKVLSFIYPIYNRNWRNIITLYIYTGEHKNTPYFKQL